MSTTIDKQCKGYSNAKIYQVLNRINDKVYVGSTCQPLCKRMVIHRQYAVDHEGKLYDEMRRLCKTHFYIELIENYPCGNKDDLIARQQFYIKERGTLNNRATINAKGQADGKSEILELKVMVHDMHSNINRIEAKIDSLLNTLYPSGFSTPISEDEEEE